MAKGLESGQSAYWRKMRRLFVLKRDGRRCVYCGCKLDKQSVTTDHVIPKKHGGEDRTSNIVAACGQCNYLKGDKLPANFIFERHA